ncbi:MAG: C4-dicarboxylate ABC transporter permease, partial [Proteobacteria bacterium]
MDAVYFSPILIVALLALLASGIWIAIALAGVAIIAMLLVEAPIDLVMPSSIWSSVSSWSLTALPLFIWMGEILFRTRLADDLFHGLAPWVHGVQGVLLPGTVIVCGIFG